MMFCVQAAPHGGSGKSSFIGKFDMEGDGVLGPNIYTRSAHKLPFPPGGGGT